MDNFKVRGKYCTVIGRYSPNGSSISQWTMYHHWARFSKWLKYLLMAMNNVKVRGKFGTVIGRDSPNGSSISQYAMDNVKLRAKYCTVIGGGLLILSPHYTSGVLWWEDWSILCLAGLLHCLASTSSNCWHHSLCIRTSDCLLLSTGKSRLRTNRKWNAHVPNGRRICWV